MPCNAGMWSCAPTTGERPPPCSNFTFTTIDDRRAVLFGGRNGEQGSMNDVYIIDLHTMVMTVLLYPYIEHLTLNHYNNYSIPSV